MDKQEAVNFIFEELGKDRPQADIAAELSGKLGAPAEMVAKFVAQVAGKEQSQSSPVAPTGPPPGAQAAPSSSPAQPAVAPAAEPPAAATTAAAQAFLQGNAMPVQEAGPVQKSTPAPEDDPELEAIILKALGKSKRHSDVVVMVCEQTGLNWEQAQRVVARVETRNRKSLTAKQNRLVLPLTIIAIIVGIALIAAGISEGYAAAAQFQDITTGDGYVPNIEYIIREGIWTIGTGGALLLGGIAGLIVFLQKQFD
ncbi:hypothetical protein ACFLZW_02415 [Chloroflexota bacterium]